LFDETTIIIWVCPTKIEAFIKYVRIMTEKSSDSIDRRKSARVNIQVQVAFFFPSSNTPGVIQARISNVSEGGALIVIFMRELLADSLIEMSFMMPDKNEEDGRDRQRLVVVKGRIRYTKPLGKNLFESGVEFQHLEEKDRVLIRKCIASHPRK
jgi:c-di-GMP-binding flagellar brake protein YcgR